MRQEGFAGAIGDRAARRLAPPARAHPAGLEQHVERAGGGRHAADFLDLGARHRLVIGDDGQRLDRRARELARLHGVLGQQPGEVAGGAEGPFPPDAHQVDAARRVFCLQRLERIAQVHAFGKPGAKRRFVERLAGGKQQRLEQAQFLRTRGRLRDVGDVHLDHRHFFHVLHHLVSHDHELLGHARHRLGLLMRFLVCHASPHFRSHRRHACACRSARRTPSGGFRQSPRAPARARWRRRMRTRSRPAPVPPHKR